MLLLKAKYLLETMTFTLQTILKDANINISYRNAMAGNEEQNSISGYN